MLWARESSTLLMDDWFSRTLYTNVFERQLGFYLPLQWARIRYANWTFKSQTIDPNARRLFAIKRVA